ncbi:MAG: S49 family peptidase, partial [Alphaproteobacteria bacterium]|nr:S49 family peptidase [Alphaproteobacteria bacterium]
MKTIAKLLVYIFAAIGGLMFMSIFGLIGFIAFYGSDASLKDTPDNAILWLDFNGYVPERNETGDFFGGHENASFLDYLQAIRAAKNDDKIIAIATELNATNLGLAQIQEIRQELIAFRSETGKRTYLYSEDLGAMGNGMLGYYLASSFSVIWLNPTGGVGLSGLAIEVPFFKDALDRFDIRAEMEQRHEFKGGADPFIRSKMTAPLRASLTGMVNEWQTQIFNDMLAQRWQIELNEQELLTQSPFLASKALDAKLVSKIAYWDEFDEMLDQLGGPKGSNFIAVEDYKNIKDDFSPTSEASEKIAVIQGIGPISNEDYGSGYYTDDTFSPYTVMEAIRDAREDDDVKAILFRVSSPGGAYAQSDMVRREIQKTRESGKPVIVS